MTEHRVTPIEHGTAAGYLKHRRRGEDACVDCKRANAASALARSRKKGVQPLRTEPYTHLSDLSYLDARLRSRGWTVTDAGCWEWRGGTTASGYGTIWAAGKPRRAHRLAHLAWIGPIPDGLVVMHACDNPPCINPDHLSVGTHADNIRDRDAKGRHGSRRATNDGGVR